MATIINIPYRCPYCGNSEKFETLQELRMHLQTEHVSNFDQSQRWTNFTGTNHSSIVGHKFSHHSSLLELFHADARKLEEDLTISKQDELNNRKSRSEFEGITSSKINVPNRRTFGSCPSKATFREYGHPSRLNKSLYPNKFTIADSRFDSLHFTLPNKSDEDCKTDSSPLANNKFSLPDKMFYEQKNKQSFNNAPAHTNNGIKSYQDQCYQLPLNKRIDNKHVIETLNALSHDVLLERASQHATANSFYTAQEVLSGIEQAAEERIAQQQFVTDALAQELTEKETRLANVMHHMQSLQHQQLETMEKMNLMKQKYDYENKQLQKELQQKQTELDSLNKQITETKQFVIKDNETIFQRPEKLVSNDTSRENEPLDNHFHSACLPVSSSIHINNDREIIQNLSSDMTNDLQKDKLTLHESSSKDKELTVLKKKAQQLERDKQNLLMEMQNLLETASTDNDKLKTELDSRSEKLSKLNCDLEQSKQEQAELLDETNALYHQADVSLSVLKTLLKEREHQLISVSGSLEQAKTNQEKLTKERDECFVLAKEKEDMYKSLLASNSSQVKSIKKILDSSQQEKQKLEKGVYDLREKLAAKDERDRQLTDNVTRLQSELAEKEKTQAEMEEKVRRREEKLKKARCEMERVTMYLKTTAEKELEARSKLEVFISGLIDRAGRAEAKLQRLKSQQLDGSSKKRPRHGDVSHLNYQSSVSHKAFLQGNFSTPRELPDDKANRRLDHPHYHSQENLLDFYSIPKGTAKFNTNASTSRHPDTITNKDQQRSSTSVVNHNSSSSKGQQRYGYQNNRDVAVGYRQSLSSKAPLHPSFHHDTSHLIFENTPEVDKMFQNVSRLAYTQPSDLLQSQKWHKTDGNRVERLMPHYREQDSIDLHIDDNGIMWEQVSPYYLTDTNVQFNDKYRPFLNERVEHMRLNDDTDVDEDLTDYVNEEEQVTREESEEVENLHPKSKAASINTFNNSRLATLQKDHNPFVEKIVKHASSTESEAIQTNSKHLYSDNLQQSRLHFEKANNNNSQNIKCDPLKAANDYSTTDSSESSPLYKARAVQKRLEQLSSLNSNLPRPSSSSKQSGGFEVNHLDRESDFSSSSYASLGHPDKLLKQEESKQQTQMKVSHDSAVKELNHYAPTSSSLIENKNNSENSPHTFLDNNRSENSSNISSEPNHGYVDILTTASMNNSGHSDTNLPIAHATAEQSGVLNCENYIEILEHDSLKESINGSLNSLEEPVLAEDTPSKILENQELIKNTDDEQKPAKVMRVRILSQSETQTTSSEDDLLDDNVSPQRQSWLKKSVDASTDTDLEKLARPGQSQKVFVVKKTMPNKKRIVRKKSRPKAQLRQFSSQESLSSEPGDFLDEERIKRLAVRKMRVALFRVFSYLDTRTLLTVACVSREWHRVSRHPALWRHVLLANSSISSEFLITLSKWCTQTKSLSLKGLRGRGIMAEESPENFQLASRDYYQLWLADVYSVFAANLNIHIREQELKRLLDQKSELKGSLEQGLETFLSTCHDTITEIHISDCDTILTDKCLWLVSGYCRLLTTLTYLSSKDPITPQLMWALGGGCPGITRLFVHPQHPCEKTGAMNNRCLLLIAQLYQDIEELSLGGKEFDRAGLLPLVTSCQRLKSLHLDHCLAITADLASALCQAGLKFLHTLAISNTYVEAKAIQNFKESCRQLKRIHVSVNIQDCVDDPSKAKDKETYKKMVKALEALKGKSGFGIIFTLEAMSVN